MQILLATSSSPNAQVTARAMMAAGIVADHASRGDQVIEMLANSAYDAVVLAADLPVFSGLHVLKQMRRAQNAMPALILADASNPAANVEAFRSGADDVVAIPVEHEELVARLRAIVRRARPAAASVVRIDAMEINLDTHEVTCHGRPVSLTAKEFAILQLLVQRRGMVLTKDAFLNHLYGGMDEPEMKIIDVFICKLRKKLQLAGVDDLIVTVWGKGYTLRESGRDHVEVPQQSSPVSARTRQVA